MGQLIVIAFLVIAFDLQGTIHKLDTDVKVISGVTIGRIKERLDLGGLVLSLNKYKIHQGQRADYDPE